MTIKRVICVLFFVVLAMAAIRLLVAQQPAVLPELTHKRLLNDLQIILATTPQMGDDLTIGLVLRYGSAFDPAEKGGVAYLTSRLLGSAAQDRSAKDIQDELKYLGATLEVRCDWDGIRLLLHGQSPRFERSLLLLYQIAGEALLNESDFARVKSEVLQEIARTEDPRQRTRSRFEELLFRGTTYGRPLRGTAASVNNISLGDVRLFYRRYFSPNAAALAVVGSVPPVAVLQKATRIWGVWVRKDEVPFTFLPPRNPASRTVHFEDDPASPAAQFILGNLWPRREDPQHYSAGLASRLLQDRLTKALPTSLLTVGSEGRRMSGPFYIQGQAAAEQAIEEIRKILDVVEEFKGTSISAEQLASAQKLWIEEFNNAARSTDGTCGALLDSELYRLGTNYTSGFPDLVRRQDPETVKNTAKDWFFPGGVVILVRGPAASLKSGLEALGAVQPVAP